MGAPAVFLDRDGVITRAVVRQGRPHAPASLDEVEVLPGVERALRALRDAGFRLVVVTNQPDVARGRLLRSVVDATHARLARLLPIDEFRVCDHDDADDCECRKPKPGLITTAAREADLNLQGSFMVGDRWRDVDAGRRAGCTTVFIDRGYAESPPRDPDAVVGSLPEAAAWILARSGSARP